MAENATVSGQVSNVWGRIPPLLRLGISIAIVALIGWFLWNAFSGFLIRWEPLAAGLQDAEQARVLEYLRSQGVNYRVEGGTIMAPADRASELKIEMAGQDLQVGLLRGLERLESVGIGDTEKTIHAKRQLALQEEIQKALNSLPMIHASQVRLALPEDRGFLASSEQPAKASVWLTLRPGARLSDEQVRGLQIQIAHSIQNLQADDVSILDHNSNLLSQRTGDTVLAVVRQKEEQRIKEQVVNLLGQTLDPGRIRVAATVELDRISRKETRKDIDTTKPAETSFQSVEEESSGGGGAGGAPGTEANTGDATASGYRGAASSSTRSEESRQTDYPTVLTEVEYKPGEVKKRSVAVVIDLRRTLNEDGTEQYVSWGQNSLQNWEQALHDAVGIDETRGDRLTLTETSFEHLHRMAVELERDQLIQQQRRMYDLFDWSDWTSFIKIPVIILFSFILLWFFVRPIGKRVLAPLLALPSRSVGQIPDRLPKTVEELEAEMEGRLEEELELPPKEVKKGTVLKKRLVELAKNEPEGFSQLVRSWLYE